jgi:hypothetical protein
MWHRIVIWVYSKRPNFILVHALCFGVPMYGLYALLSEGHGWVAWLFELTFTILGSLLFAYGMWFAIGTKVAARLERQATADVPQQAPRK